MVTQFYQRTSHRPAAPPRRLLRQNLDRAVHPDGKDLLDIGNVGIDRPVLDIRPEPPDRRLHDYPIRRVQPHHARQAQQLHRPLQRQTLGRPALRQAGAWRLRGRFGRLALLHIRPEPARAQRDVQASLLPQNPAIDAAFFIAGNRPGKPTLRIIAATDERPTGAGRFQMQTPGAADLTDARV